MTIHREILIYDLTKMLLTMKKKPCTGNCISVLYVDDDKEYIELTKSFLDDLFDGFIIVHSLNDPQKVFDELKNKKYDILVSDYSMEGMNGLELLEEVKKAGNDLPFVIFTGRSREEVAIQALNLGADYYIKKGGDPDSQFRELGHVIQRVVHYNRTLERLRESEEKLSHLMSQNLLGMVIIQGGRIKFANQAISRITGYTIEEMLSWSYEEFANFIHPDDRQFVIKQARKFQSGDESAIKHYSFKVITKNGETKYLDKYSETIDYGGSKADLVSIIDITDRIIRNKAFEEMFLESEERYRTLLETMNEGLLIQDKDNIITYVNDTFCRMFLHSKEELIGSSTANFLDEKSREIFRKQTQRKYNSSSKKYELTGIRKDRSKIKIYVSPRAILTGNGKFKGSFAVVTDITSLKKVEETLRASEEKYKKLIDLSPDAITITDSDFNFTSVNRQALKVHGINDADILLGKNALDLIHPNDHERAMVNARKTLEQGIIRNIQYNMLRYDGSVFPAELSTSVIYDENNIPSSYIAIIRDISHRKKVEEESKRQKEELNDFADFISHDVNNRLTTLIGYIKLMEKKKDFSYLSQVESQARYMQQQLCSSLKLAKAGRVIENKESVDTNSLIDKIAEIAIPKYIVFQRDDLPRLFCDPDKISQVFTNLLENAVIHGKPRNIQVRSREERNKIVLSVLNDGIPMDSGERERIFQRGSLSKERVGMGMIIVKKIIQAHGWDIRLLPDKDLTIFEIII